MRTIWFLFKTVFFSSRHHLKVSTWVLGHMEVTDKLGWWMLKAWKTSTEILTWLDFSLSITLGGYWNTYTTTLTCQVWLRRNGVMYCTMNLQLNLQHANMHTSKEKKETKKKGNPKLINVWRMNLKVDWFFQVEEVVWDFRTLIVSQPEEQQHHWITLHHYSLPTHSQTGSL